MVALPSLSPAHSSSLTLIPAVPWGPSHYAERWPPQILEQAGGCAGHSRCEKCQSSSHPLLPLHPVLAQRS